MGQQHKSFQKKSRKTLTPTSLRLLSGTEKQFRDISEIISVPEEPFDLDKWMNSRKALSRINFNKLVNEMSLQKKSLMIDLILHSIGIEDPNSRLLDLIEEGVLNYTPNISEATKEKNSRILLAQYNHNTEERNAVMTEKMIQVANDSDSDQD